MMQSFGFRAMNTSVILAAEGEAVSTGFHATQLFIDTCEQRFSRFLPASELSALNRSAGNWLQISSEMMEMLQLSLKYHLQTNGIFDPSILPDLKRAGYDRSMDRIRAGELTDLPHASNRPPRPAFREIDFDLADNRVCLPRGMEIDLGGIAKGWIIDKAAHLLHDYAEVCAVSAGGDILFIGQPSGGLGWDVFMEDPRDPSRILVQFQVPGGAVATSSVMKRTWVRNEKPQHHLIDPRTGEPADTHWLSVTVIAPAILTAEIYAKAILIGGEQEIPNLLKTAQPLTFMAVDPSGKLVGSPGYQEYLYELTPDSILSTNLLH